MESDWIGSGLDSARLCWIGLGQVGLVLECVGLYCKWIRQHQAGLVGPDGLDWIGLDWVELPWVGLNWSGLDWASLVWIGSDWIGSVWKVVDWIGLGWTG